MADVRVFCECGRPILQWVLDPVVDTKETRRLRKSLRVGDMERVLCATCQIRNLAKKGE
jgi:hypothetical protein